MNLINLYVLSTNWSNVRSPFAVLLRTDTHAKGHKNMHQFNGDFWKAHIS